MIDTVRREKIRGRVNERLNAAHALQAQLTDRAMQEQLRMPVNWLGDVEQLYLHDVRADRTDVQESFWLDQAERYFEFASQELQRIEKIVERYGPNASAG